MRNDSVGAGWFTGRRRVWTAILAGGLAALLVVDPFAVGSATQAAGDETVEDRAANLSSALEALPAEAPRPATELVGSRDEPVSDVIELPTAILPGEDAETVPLPDSEPATVDLGGMDVTVQQVAGEPAPDSVELRVADPEEAAAAGVTGLLLDVEDASEGAGDVEATDGLAVQLRLSYADFGELAGGDWGSRLQFVRIPECAPEAADAAECAVSPLDTVNDPVTQTVSAVVPVAAASEASSAALRGMSAGTPASAKVGVVAAAAGPNGNWGATSLSPSSSWGTSGGTGAFTWSYPLTVPAAPAGPEPELAVSYSSATSDGRIPSTNNQAGWIGEGFDLTSGYIERTYVPCGDDEAGGANNAGRPSADLCWGAENATMMFLGSATELIRDKDSGRWTGKRDDGTRIELLTGGWSGGQDGEYWKVTTVDGVQYFFGRGQRSAADGTALGSAWTVPVYGNHPGDRCYRAPSDGGFAASRCMQVWRWNLDYVVDPSGNSMTYAYTPEQNHYVPDAYAGNPGGAAVAYASGGRLDRIEYGTRAGAEAAGSAPARVMFTAAPRCATSPSGTALCAPGEAGADGKRWPDSPSDQFCRDAAGCTTYTPVFFDRTRLATVTTQAFDGTTYRNLNSWAFTQRFVAEGAGGDVEYATNVLLQLDSIRRTAFAGTAATADDIVGEPVRFTYEFKENRVDADGDGHPPLWRPRLIGIVTDAGGQISVAYRTECAAGDVPGVGAAAQRDNKRLCFPVRWNPDRVATPRIDWFHKYVVATVVEDGAAPAPSGGGLVTGSPSQVTTYGYPADGAAWAKPTGPLVDAAEATYSEFRGFRTVTTTLGIGDDASVEVASYLRGTGGQVTAGPGGAITFTDDKEAHAGTLFSTLSRDGSTPVSQAVTVPGELVVTATGGDGRKATRVQKTTAHGYSYDASGAVAHHTRTVTTFDQNSQPISVDDQGDVATAADDVCTRITYARGAALDAAHLVSLAEKTETVSVACGTVPATPAQLVSSDLADYDSAGRVTQTRTLDPSDGIGHVPDTAVLEYDARGRALRVADAAGEITTTAYGHDTRSGQLLSVTSTTPDPDGSGPRAAFAVTRTMDPLTGLVTAEADQNGKVTTGTYDALGRLRTVTYPQHRGLAHPSVAYSYAVRRTGLNAVTTRTLSADGGTQHAAVTLYDGMLRPFQTQTEALGAGAQGDIPAADRGRMVTHTYYDSAGRVSDRTGQWHATGTVSATPINPVADPPSHTTYEYDGAGRVTDEVLWNGTSSNPDYERWRTRTIYDGATILTIPPQGGTPTESTVDARGQTIRLREYLRDPETQADRDTAAEVRQLASKTTAYAYTPAGLLSSMTDAGDNTWTYRYDWAGRQIGATDPDSGTTTTTYDALGQVTTRTDGNGDTLAYTYDPLGRVTSLRDGSGTGPVRVAWVYDTAKDTAGKTVLGPVASATRTVDGADYRTAYPVYDEAYRPVHVDTALPGTDLLGVLGGKTYRTSYRYAADGQMAAVTLPAVVGAGGKVVLGAETVTTHFDSASMPTWMGGGFGWGTYVADSFYAADGKPMARDLGNTYGAVVSYRWEDGTDRLTGISLDRQGVNGTEIDLAYAYDDAGNVTSVRDRPSTASLGGVAGQDNQCFDYDGLRRLASAWTAADGDCAAAPTAARVGGAAPYWKTYTYDLLGNRTGLVERAGSAVTSTSYAYAGDAPHQVSSTTVTAAGADPAVTVHGWDAAGNETSRSGAVSASFLWDAEGELSSATVAGKTTASVWDASGELLVRPASGGVTVFLPGGQEMRLYPSGVVSGMRWYSFAGAQVAVRTGPGMRGVTSVVSDHHGTSVAKLHNTTRLLTKVRSDPFGGVRAGGMVLVGGRGLLGAPADDVTGLVLLGARFYDPGAGRFLSVDPVLDPQTPSQWNAYAYSYSNPVTFSDPSGLRPDETPAGHTWHGSQGFKKSKVSSPASPGTLVTSSTGGGGERATGGQQGCAGPACDAARFITEDPAAMGVSTVCGFIPVAGSVCAVGETIAYAMVGDVGGASLAAAGILPFVGGFLKAGRAGVKVSNAVAHSAKTANGGDVAAREAGALVPYNSQTASRTLLGQVGDGYAMTPGGRTASAHAADRIANGGGGRPPTTLARVDDILDNPSAIKYDPLRDTVKVSQGRAYVVVSGTGQQHIVTVMIPR